MPLEPGYGETPISDEDLYSLMPGVRDVLGDPLNKADIYDLEQDVQVAVTEARITEVLNGSLTVADLLDPYFLRDLHKQLYGEIWTWAGVFRTRELSIGVDPFQIATQLRSSLDSIRYRWEQTSDWTARQLGIAAHAETVRIHPFTDGNGRVTRLLADLLFTAAQDGDDLQQYNWNLDKNRYITLLREYDSHRDASALAAFIEVVPFGS